MKSDKMIDLTLSEMTSKIKDIVDHINDLYYLVDKLDVRIHNLERSAEKFLRYTEAFPVKDMGCVDSFGNSVKIIDAERMLELERQRFLSSNTNIIASATAEPGPSDPVKDLE